MQQLDDNKHLTTSFDFHLTSLLQVCKNKGFFIWELHERNMLAALGAFGPVRCCHLT